MNQNEFQRNRVAALYVLLRLLQLAMYWHTAHLKACMLWLLHVIYAVNEGAFS